MGEKREVVVIGSGPGGYVAAIKAAQSGKQVTVIEKKSAGGTCLNVGCIPSKALITASHHFQHMLNGGQMGLQAGEPYVNMAQFQQWKNGIVSRLTGGVRQLLKGNKIEFIEGRAEFTGKHTIQVASQEGQTRTLQFKHAIIATGSAPVELPGLSWNDRVLSSTGALALDHIPEKIIVVGGGYIGMELGTAYANLGSRVTFLEGASQLLPGFSQELVAIAEKKLQQSGNVDIVKNAMVEKAEKHGDGRVTVQYSVDDELKTAEGNYVFVTVGRKPNTKKLGLENCGVQLDERGFITINDRCATSQPHIFAAGDVTNGPALAHRASFQGKVAADNIAGEDSVDEQVIPAVVFSDPELASVGLSVEEAKKAGYDAVRKSFPFAANGRALTMESSSGYVELILNEEDGLLLGARVAGPLASELINELTVAIQSQLTAEDLSLAVHFHPSLGETIMEAAEFAMGHPIHKL
ncbi:dihydrolipoyl dehydrogenase [Salipaludibacillus sp. CUR1]|uniref:dihydrolipoyl dehydrogenase n=1 Tax=Salipaludibacillus sp. CUR1 TaxID=2820003 RepID=UPI001E4DE7A2|nr:dihydrolipoyl dehydrogenase [Salipaludibacillus sp. CUR1]MCE7792525.1 dihydrolipoyl dehydrogenase [Salipaludibacillus sp. CUR1]